MHNNPNLILTYSKDYLGLSIDPFTLAEEGKRNKEFEDSLMYSKNKFSSLLVRTKEERMRLLKKPA